MIANFGFSQSNTRLQGPAAKNAKPWHKKTKSAKLVYHQNKEFLKGPTAKNKRLWQKEDLNQNYVVVKSTDRHKLNSPQVKNIKYWRSPTQKSIKMIAIRTKNKDATEIKLASE